MDTIKRIYSISICLFCPVFPIVFIKIFVDSTLCNFLIKYTSENLVSYLMKILFLKNVAIFVL